MHIIPVGRNIMIKPDSPKHKRGDSVIIKPDYYYLAEPTGTIEGLPEETETELSIADHIMHLDNAGHLIEGHLFVNIDHVIGVVN